jgi:exonuclease SbcD
MKIAITADWHVGSSRGTYPVGSKNNRELDMEKQIKIMLKYCIDEAIQTLVIAGDLFDRSMVDGYWFSRVLAYIRKFTNEGIDIIIIPGNHDVTGALKSITHPLSKMKESGVEVIEELITKKIGNMNFALIPHIKKNLFQNSTFSEYIESFFKDIKYDAVIGHFQPIGAVPGSEQEMFAGSSRIVDTRIFGKKTIIAGHVHKPQDKDNIHIIGSPVRFDMGERMEEKRFLTLDTYSGKIESINLKCQKMYKVKIDLINKKEFKIAPDKLNKYKDSLVGIEVSSSKENRARFTWGLIINKFDEVNAHIVSRKINIEKNQVLKKSRDDNREGYNFNKIFSKVLKDVIKSEEKKKRIEKLGINILDTLKIK